MAGVTLSWPLAFDPGSVTVTGGGTVTSDQGLDAPVLRNRTNQPRRGIAIPIGVNKRGGTRTVTSDANDRKIIATALSDNNNEHAFQQDPGLGADFVFGISDAAVRGIIIQRLRDVFADFERQNRYRLDESSAVWTEGEGELVLDFDYFNIETDEPKHFRGVLNKDVT